MALVCGIDLGSFSTPGYVAWLEDGQFVLDAYQPSASRPCRPSPGGWPPAFTGIDGAQGLPAVGERSRRADLQAGAPTKVLPRTRAELAGWRLYRPFVEAGIEIFWQIHERELASILGLVPVPGADGIVFETYPRYVLLQLWGARPPSKRREPAAYVDFVWSRLRARRLRLRRPRDPPRPRRRHALRPRRRSLPPRRRPPRRHRRPAARGRRGRARAARRVTSSRRRVPFEVADSSPDEAKLLLSMLLDPRMVAECDHLDRRH